jgi:hypothetical protein
MTDVQKWEYDVNWDELWNALCTVLPDHVGGQPDWVEYIRELAAHTDFYDSDELWEAAEPGDDGQDGAETVALFVACHWLRNVKADFLCNSAFAVTSREVAKLHLVRVDELVQKLVVAIHTPIVGSGRR